LEFVECYLKGEPAVVKAAKAVVVAGEQLTIEDAMKKEESIFAGLWGGPINLKALERKKT
jgi:hypothetical protein